MMRLRWVLSFVAVGLILGAVIPIALSITRVETAGGWTEIRTGAMLGGGYDARSFYVRVGGDDWQPTYAGTDVEGRLFNFRAANAIFDDEDDPGFNANANTSAFISNLDAYREHGVLAFTVSLQGGNPGYEGADASGFTSDGSLKGEWMDRAARVIEAADSRGQVIILTYFYFRQDQVLDDSDAVRQAVRNATDWVIENNYRNVIIEIANEHDHGSYDHDLISDNSTNDGIGELITLARSRFDGQDWRPPISASPTDISFSGGLRATADVALVHGNSTPDWAGEDTYSEMESIYDSNAVPVVMNEDDNGDTPGETLLERDTHALDDAIEAGGSWGLMWAEYNQYAPFRWALGDPNQINTQAGYFHAILDVIQSRTGEPSTPPSTPTPTETPEATETEEPGATEPTVPGDGEHGLQFSFTSDRSAPATLHGATVSGDVYAFVPADPDIDNVAFYLDGEFVRVENFAPFDFAASEEPDAFAWDSTNVADGEHTITAVVTLDSGETVNVTATFIVANEPDEPEPTTEPTSTPEPTQTSTPTTTPEPTTTVEEPTVPDDGAYHLQYSLSRDRSNPQDLHGATISGYVYPFVTPEANISGVQFHLDGEPEQYENNPPFDFGSGTPSLANPWNTMTVGDGVYTIEAELYLDDGSTTTTSATFTVANDADAPPTPTATPTATPTSTPTEEPTPTEEEPTEPEESAYEIQYSHSDDRSDPEELDGATVSGLIHPFVIPETEVRAVWFFLNGDSEQYESNPPFDFGSGTVGEAYSWDTTQVPDGRHTIEALLYFRDGSTMTIGATFTVAN